MNKLQKVVHWSAIVKHDAQCKIFLVNNIKDNVWHEFGDGLYVAMKGEVQEKQA